MTTRILHLIKGMCIIVYTCFTESAALLTLLSEQKMYMVVYKDRNVIYKNSPYIA